MRVYVPATVPMLRELVEQRELRALGGTAFAVTPTLREAYASGDDEELAEVAMGEAARAALRLIAAERDAITDSMEEGSSEDAAPALPAGAPVYRRAVIAADVAGAKLRPDLDDAVVRLSGPISYDRIASVHVDLADAEPAVAKAVDVIDAADLGDTDAEFVLGDAEDHQLAWYAAQELPFLLELL
ncbi:hypothetical protein GV794_04200 [Nocardia cyriacigeorgica]|uniref:Uncharacterized protein n=2 Tax=Nocardia cyriacigeorgica TaxID=135487 RepID=A0A6P1D9G4_9NOCA|nr:hypothetical protein [Nocardia cyriacigeorgica]NEW50637.1 hypothetical protein [Nocardia cyriacigeorgica]NEW54875.1 hypothetical protein [Nocardia cyriacigeorgica]